MPLFNYVLNFLTVSGAVIDIWIYLDGMYCCKTDTKLRESIRYVK